MNTVRQRAKELTSHPSSDKSKAKQANYEGRVGNTYIARRHSSTIGILSYHRRNMKLTSNASTSMFFSLAVAAALGIAPTALALKENCIEQLPPTIYEAAEMSPQNMDFDAKNNVSICIALCRMGSYLCTKCVQTSKNWHMT